MRDGVVYAVGVAVLLGAFLWSAYDPDARATSRIQIHNTPTFYDRVAPKRMSQAPSPSVRVKIDADPQENYKAGNVAFREERFGDAVALYEAAAVHFPQSSNVLHNLAAAYSRLSHFERALEIFDRVLEKNPTHIQASFNKGMCLVALHDFPNATRALQRVLELDPSHSDARRILEQISVESAAKPEKPAKPAKPVPSSPNALDQFSQKRMRSFFDVPGRKRLIGLQWQLGAVTGWGIFGIHLAEALLSSEDFFPITLRTVHSSALDCEQYGIGEGMCAWVLQQRKWGENALQNISDDAPQIHVDFLVIHAVPGLFLERPKPFWGSLNIGASFFEEGDLQPTSIKLSREYDVIVVGSSWNAKTLREYYIPHVEVIFQGVDVGLYHPSPKKNLFPGRYVVFSGGKLESRKGQDIVIDAFKRFAANHTEALLMVAWANMWANPAHAFPQLYVKGYPEGTGGAMKIEDWLATNGIPRESVHNLGLITQRHFSQVIREADLAVFTNRAEGGTNLVAMEVMASGVPVILSNNTGHRDLIQAHPSLNCFPIQRQGQIILPSGRALLGWGESHADDVVRLMERAYENREEGQRRAQIAAQFIKEKMTWEHTTQQWLEILTRYSSKASKE